MMQIDRKQIAHIDNGLDFFQSVVKDLASSSAVSGVQRNVLAATTESASSQQQAVTALFRALVAID